MLVENRPLRLARKNEVKLILTDGHCGLFVLFYEKDEFSRKGLYTPFSALEPAFVTLGELFLIFYFPPVLYP